MMSVLSVAPVTVACWPLRSPRSWRLRWAMTRSPTEKLVVSFCQTGGPRVPARSSWWRARWLRSATSLRRAASMMAWCPAATAASQSATSAVRTVSVSGPVVRLSGSFQSSQCIVDVDLAEGAERGSLVRVGLAAVLGQLDGGDAAGDSREGAAGVDLGELTSVADQHELGPGLVGGVDEAGEVAGADHGGFVDDEHGSLVEEGPAGVEDAGEAVDGLGLGMPAPDWSSAVARAESAATEDRVAVVVVGVAEAVEGGGLPAPAWPTTSEIASPDPATRSTRRRCSPASRGRACSARSIAVLAGDTDPRADVLGWRCRRHGLRERGSPASCTPRATVRSPAPKRGTGRCDSRIASSGAPSGAVRQTARMTSLRW